MKTIKSLVLALALCASMPAMAQFAGGGSSSSSDNENFSRVYAGYDGKLILGGTASGFSAGYSYNLSISESMPAYVDFGGRFSYNSVGNFNIAEINIPIHFDWRVNVSDAIAIQPYTGPQLGIIVTDTPNRVELSWQVGAFADFGKFGVGFEYGYQFLNAGYSNIFAGVSYKF